MIRFLLRVYHWLVQLFRRYFNDGCSYRAAYLAYLTLVSLVPVLAISATILSRLPYFDMITVDLQSWLIDGLLGSETTTAKPLINELINHALTMSLWHIMAFSVAALLMMINIGDAFSSIWHSERRFSWRLSFLIYLVVLLLSPILLAILFVSGSILNQWLSLFVAETGYHFLTPIFNSASYSLLFVWLFMMNLILPACRVPVKAALLSGVVTTAFLWIGQRGFSVFIQNFSNYQDLYGPLYVIPVFLVWLYLSWMLILLGALIGQSVVCQQADRSLRG
jgi:membrane protein